MVAYCRPIVSLMKSNNIFLCEIVIRNKFEITAVLRTRRLRWYGHVQRATSCINSITLLGLPGTRDRGRPRKTWSACVRNDMTICNLDGVNPLDRNSWRTSVRRCQVPGVAYPGVRDNRSTLNTKTGYDDMMNTFLQVKAEGSSHEVTFLVESLFSQSNSPSYIMTTSTVFSHQTSEVTKLLNSFQSLSINCDLHSSSFYRRHSHDFSLLRIDSHVVLF